MQRRISALGLSQSRILDHIARIRPLYHCPIGQLLALCMSRCRGRSSLPLTKSLSLLQRQECRLWNECRLRYLDLQRMNENVCQFFLQVTSRCRGRSSLSLTNKFSRKKYGVKDLVLHTKFGFLSDIYISFIRNWKINVFQTLIIIGFQTQQKLILSGLIHFLKNLLFVPETLGITRIF